MNIHTYLYLRIHQPPFQTGAVLADAPVEPDEGEFQGEEVPVPDRSDGDRSASHWTPIRRPGRDYLHVANADS